MVLCFNLANLNDIRSLVESLCIIYYFIDTYYIIDERCNIYLMISLEFLLKMIIKFNEIKYESDINNK